MLFVGHISIAFLLTYVISKKFVLKDISVSFAMFLSTLPDIDLLFRLFGVKIGYMQIPPEVFLVVRRWIRNIQYS
jgi:hypothetical protein